MTDQESFSQGEIQRSLARLEKGLTELTAEVRERHHALREVINVQLGPISAHTIQIESQQKAIERLDDDMNALALDVKAVTKDANRIAGAGAILAVLAGVVPWPWRR
jgi:archaellum component FlaC